jgi:predicted ABC-type sugar transport system permease subunit
VLPLNAFIGKLVFVSAVIAGITWVMAGYRGLSWAAAILIVVVLAYSYVTTKTVIGRHIYAVGGNPEAAELNGISVKKDHLFGFWFDGPAYRLGGHPVCVLVAVRHHDRRNEAWNWMPSPPLLSVAPPCPAASARLPGRSSALW